MAANITAEEFKTKVFDYEKNTEWKYQGEIPTIVDFYADWCGPCKMLAPTIEKLSKEYDGKVNFYKVNTEEEPSLSAAFGIQSIPTLLFIPMEGKPQMSAGALPENQIKKIIDENLI